MSNSSNFDINKPFFAYGIFRPGEISFLGIKECVDNVVPTTMRGDIMWWDGVPLLTRGNGDVDGYRITFKKDTKNKYVCKFFIEGIEPSNLYKWEIRDNCNVLIGRLPYKRAETRFEVDFKTIWDDPYFVVDKESNRWKNSLLKLLYDFLEVSQSVSNKDIREIFEVQMRYLLLWTLIERFTQFRYNTYIDNNTEQISLDTETNAKQTSRDTITERNIILSKDPYFREACQKYIKRENQCIYNTKGTSKGLYLNGYDEQRRQQKNENWLYQQNIEYYYQVRCNITHRGKALHLDYDILKDSYRELLEIMNHILVETKKECDEIRLKYETRQN